MNTNHMSYHMESLLLEVGYLIRHVGKHLEAYGTCEDAEADEIYCSNGACTYGIMARVHEALRKRVES